MNRPLKLLLGLLPLLLSCGDGGPSGPPSGDPVTITTPSLADGEVGTPYTAALAATGGTGTHAWSLEAGSLPDGLALSVGGTISGTPNTVGTSAFTVRATSAGESATRAYAVNILSPPIAIGTASLPDGQVGANYSQVLAATGGGGSFAWSVVSGSLPAGLSISGAGVISGTPTSAGSTTFTVQAASGGRTSTRVLTITIAAQPLAVTTTALADGVVGSVYGQVLAAAGGSGAYAWTLASGTLPAGLTLSTGGAITGTPGAGGTSSFTVRVTSGAQQATRALTITVQAPSVSITTTTLPDAFLGQAYSQALAASGGTGSYSWALAGGALPAGLGMTAAGVIGGTPSATGLSSFSVRVTSGPHLATLALTIDVVLPPVVVTTATLPGATFGVPYSQQLAATGGNGSFTWSLAGGSAPLPAGLTLSPAGVLSGTPTAVGSSTFTVRASSGGLSGTRDLTLTVTAPPLVIATAALPNGTVGVGYSQQLTATGGIGAYAWSLAPGSGPLPSGLNLSATGVLSGTPTASGSSTFTVRVVSGTQETQKTLVLTIGSALPAVVIQATSLPAGNVGEPYSQQLTATGGNGTYSWTVLAGSLPAGLTLSSSGVLGGTPTTAGSSTFSVRALSGDRADTAQFVLTIGAALPTLAITTTALPDGTQGVPYSQALAATGGTGTYTWVLDTPPLPAGLTLSAAGVISGTPTTAGGPTSFTVRVTSGGQSVTRQLAITVLYPPVLVATTSLPDGTVGSPYSQALAATGGDGSYAWSLAAGSTPLPAGLTLSPAGVISGTPTAGGTSSFTVQVSSAGGAVVATRTLSITVGVVIPPVTISTTSLPNATKDAAYSQTLGATGGSGTISWTMLAGNLPAGLQLAASGSITGTPTAVGTSSFTVEASDGVRADTADLAITVVYPPVTIGTTSLPNGAVGQHYDQLLSASGGDGSTYIWSLASSSPPPGINVLASGQVTGDPTTAGTSTFTVQATSGGNTATQQLTLTIDPTLVPGTNALAGATVGTAYSQALSATGGTGSYSWSLAPGSGPLPGGLALSSAGVLSGTPSAPTGTYDFTVQVQSGVQTKTQALSIVVAWPPVSIVQSSVPNAVVGTGYSQTLTATGGDNSTYSWSTTSGAPPANITLSSAGVLSGTAASAGAGTFTVQVTSGGQSTTRQFTLTAEDPLVISTSSPLPNGTVNVDYSQTLVATGGTAANSWSLAAGSGTLPAGLSLSSAGVLSGKPTTGGTSSFTVQVTSPAQTVTKSFDLTIDWPALSVTTTSLAGATVGTTYSQTLSASGGSGSYSWSLPQDTLPSGLSLTSAGVIGGTPSGPAGTYSFTVQVSSGGLTATKDLSIAVAWPPVSIVQSSVPNAVVGTGYSQTLTATGGDNSTYSWSTTSGAPPANITLSGAGVLSGTATSAGAGTFTVQVTSGGQSSTRQFTLTAEDPLVISTSSPLPNGTVNVDYSQTLVASGGTAANSWSLAAGSGTLPAGLSLSSAGVLSGKPTTGGTSSFTAQVTSPAQTVTKSFDLTIDWPALGVTTTSLAGATVGTTYSQTLSASGGSGSYSWSLAPGSGPLPGGLALSSAGVLSGTPSAPTGTYDFTVQVSSGGLTATKDLSITVAWPPVSIVQSSVPNAVVGTGYSQTLTATGGDNSIYSWSTTSGAPPANITLSSAGVLSGTATSAGAGTFTVQVTSGGQSTTRQFTLTAEDPLVISTSSPLPNGTVNVGYSQTFAATGGTAGNTWSLASGTLPAGLTLSSAGVLSGTPTAAGVTSSFTVRVTSPAQSVTKSFDLAIDWPALSVTTASLAPDTVGTAYSQTLSATGGNGSYTWTLANGTTLPAGLGLSSDGVISGTASGPAGTYNFTVQVSSGGQTATKGLSITVAWAPVVISPTTLPNAKWNTAYDQTLTATGGDTPGTYTWAVTSGSLPTGLTLNSSTGTLSGTPTGGPNPVNFTFTVTATGVAMSGSRSFSLQITP